MHVDSLHGFFCTDFCTDFLHGFSVAQICFARIFCTDFLHGFSRFLRGFLCGIFVWILAWIFARIFGTDFWGVPNHLLGSAKISPRKSPQKFTMLWAPSGKGLGRQEGEVATLAKLTKARVFKNWAPAQMPPSQVPSFWAAFLLVAFQAQTQSRGVLAERISWGCHACRSAL